MLRNDREWCVRAAATRALGQIGPPGIPALLDGFDARSPEERVMVLRALAWAGSEAKPLIAAQVENPEERVAEAARRALEVCGRRDEVKPYRPPAPAVTTPREMVPDLVRDLSNSWLDRQFAARDALIRAGAAAAEPLAQAMAGGRYDVLWHAEEILRVLGPEAAGAVPHLVPLLRHGDENVREVAARLLGEIGPGAAAAVPGLIKVLADRRIAVRGKAMVALGRIGPPAAAMLIEATKDQDARRRAGAAFALGWMLAAIEPAPFDPRLPLAEPGPLAETGWTPSKQQLEIATRVGIDLDYDEDLTLPGHDRAKTLAILRAGLRLRDTRAAMACAARLTVDDMDAWEAERAVELLLPECFRDDPVESYGSIYEYQGSEEVAAAIGYFALSGLSEDEFGPVAGMDHRVVRPDLIPVLDHLRATPDRWVLDASNGDITMPRSWSDPYRGAAEPFGIGLSPELRAGLAAPVMIGDWRRRWLLDSRPGPENAELLLTALARCGGAEGSDEHYDLQAVLLSLGWLKDERTEQALREYADTELCALAALVRRGDEEALRKLIARADRDTDALALLLMVQPESGRKLILEQIASADPWATCLDLGQEWPDFARVGAVPRAESFDGLTEPFLALDPGTMILARAAIAVPGLRNRRVAEEIFVRLLQEGPSVLYRTPEPDATGYEPNGVDTDAVLALLDVTDRNRLRNLLRVWVRERQDREQGFAVVQLIRMGDPQSGPLLLDWVKAHPEEAVDAYDDPELALMLARSACPEIQAWFLERVKEDARFVGAILETRGLPRNLFPSYHDAAPTEEELELLRRPPAESLEFLFRQPDTGKFDFPECAARSPTTGQNSPLRCGSFPICPRGGLGSSKESKKVAAALHDIYADVMERTTIYLDPELKRKLKEAAVRARVSEASLIREALAGYLAREKPVLLEPVGQSEDGGIADRDEEALEELGFGTK